VQLRLSRATDTRPARRVFAFSIIYLFVLFAALLTGGSIDREAQTLAAPGAWARRELAQTTLPSRLGHATRPSSSLVKTDGD
jgi:hypothetical protein